MPTINQILGKGIELCVEVQANSIEMHVLDCFLRKRWKIESTMSMEKSSPQLVPVGLAEIALRVGGILSDVLSDLVTHVFELHLGPKHVLQFFVSQL